MFEDAEAWTEWLFLDDVTWTTPDPKGPGSERTVKTGSNTFDEHFTEWEHGSHMAFHFKSGSVPVVDAFYEFYKVERLSPGRCRIIWDVAIGLKGPARLIGPLGAAVFKWQGKRAYKDLAKYVRNWTGPR